MSYDTVKDWNDKYETIAGGGGGRGYITDTVLLVQVYFLAFYPKNLPKKEQQKS